MCVWENVNMHLHIHIHLYITYMCVCVCVCVLCVCMFLSLCLCVCVHVFDWVYGCEYIANAQRVIKTFILNEDCAQIQAIRGC